MAKTTRILIPSDFTVDSLHFVRQSIEESMADSIDIILVYGNKSSTSASELRPLQKCLVFILLIHICPK